MSKQLTFPLLPAHYLHSLNAFYRRRPSLQLRYAGRAMRLAPTWLADEPDIADPYTVTVKVDGDQAELVISEGMLGFLLEELDPALSLQGLNPERTALLLEYALSEPLAAIEQMIGCQLSIVTVSKGAGKWTGPDRPGLPFVLYIERMGVAWSMLRLSSGDVARLCHFLDRSVGTARGSVDVPLPLRVRVASAAMSLSEIQSVEPGDILLPDDLARQPDGAIAVFGEYLVVPVDVTPGGYRLGARIRRGRGSPWEWSLDNGAVPSGRTENGGIDDLPMRVMFEIGTLDLDLSDVRNLGPGSMVPLSRPPGEGVDIVVNGQRIGRGKLVRIGESTGIRVTRLFGRDV